MPLFLIFAAGLFVGSKWSKIKKTLAPHLGNATEQFDALYGQVAQKVGQQYEDFEDKIAEKRYRSNGHHQ